MILTCLHPVQNLLPENPLLDQGPFLLCRNPGRGVIPYRLSRQVVLLLASAPVELPMPDLRILRVLLHA
jgi:hypothetical protein